VRRAVIDKTVKTGGARRQELKAMKRTIADELREEGERRGRILGLQNILIRCLKKRFKNVPRKVEARIRETTDVPILETWIDNCVDAETIESVGVPPD
jgi:hypothetical protein